MYLRSVPSPCLFPCWHIYLKSHVSKCVIIFTSNTAVTRLETLLLLRGFPHIGFLSHCYPLMYCLCSCFRVCLFFNVFFFLVLFTLLLVYFIQQCFCFLFSIFVYSFIISYFVSTCGDRIKCFLLMFWAETV